MARVVDDADVGPHPPGGQLNILQREHALLGAGRRRCLRRAIEDGQVALQAKPVAPVMVLAPADQIGGAVKAIAHEPNRRPDREPRRRRLQKLFLRGEPDGAVGGFNPPRQRQRPLAVA